MERLTGRFKDGEAFILPSVVSKLSPMKSEIIEKLANYEEAEEQGRLLPYKIGDIFFKPIKWKNCVDECKVSSLTIKADNTLKIRLSGMFGVFEITINEIGKTVFLTREEAEKALADMGV